MTDYADTLVQEPDTVRPRVVYGSFAALMVLIVCGWMVTWLFHPLVHVHAGLRREAAPVKTLPPELQSIDDTLFTTRAGPDRLMPSGEQTLERYRVADKTRGTVDIPIDRAMEMVLADQPIR